MVIDFAGREFGLPAELKMSVHSGSDKFSIYPVIASIIKKHNKGIHLKTAGTTWLEEVIGLAEAGGEALIFVKEVYYKALEKIDELCAPYADVIDIDRSKLPSKDEVEGWSSKKFVDSLRHIPDCKDYNLNMRQLVHVSFKLAALRMDEYFRLLETHAETVGRCVYENIYDRHICRVFGVK
jgi:hypothetical protein